MKKIVFYIGSMEKGGAQRVINNLMNYFVGKNYSITLINDVNLIESNNTFTVNSKVNRIYLDDKERNRLFKNLDRIIKLRKIIKRENPNLLISFLGTPNIRAIIATTGLKTNRIISVRNDPNKEYGTGIKKILSKIILNEADGCVFQTEEARQYFSDRLKSKSTIIYNPVSPQFYKESKKKIGENIVAIGRLEKQKNHKMLINAYTKIHDKLNGEKLIIYGEGSLREELEKYIQKIGMNPYIKLPGITNSPQKVLLESKLFVLSSNYEGMPNALMEAMAIGVPIISTDCPCGGPKELIKNKNQGLLVKCGDEIALSEAIEKIIKNEKQLNKMRREEIERAKSFRSEIILKKWENYISNYLN